MHTHMYIPACIYVPVYNTHTCRESYTKSKTKQYDEEATRYLSYTLFPLVVGYSIYALMYKTHRSWWVGSVCACVWLCARAMCLCAHVMHKSW